MDDPYKPKGLFPMGPFKKINKFNIDKTNTKKLS